jgi:hypothetical protein
VTSGGQGHLLVRAGVVQRLIRFYSSPAAASTAARTRSSSALRAASAGALGQTVLPAEEKDALVDALREAVEEIRQFCETRDVDLDSITTLRQFEWVEALKDTTLDR